MDDKEFIKNNPKELLEIIATRMKRKLKSLALTGRNMGERSHPPPKKKISM